MIKPLILLENVDVALEGQRVLSGLSWCLRAGEHWAVLGRNGSGKSTFLKLLRGELWPAPGCSGRRVYALDGDEQLTAVGVRERIASVSPELQERYLQQEWNLKVTQAIESGFGGGDYAYVRPTTAQQERVAWVVGMLGLGPQLTQSVQALSHGELRKVLVARALVGSPRVLLCDEICDGLDAAARELLLRCLDETAKAGTQILYTTHREEEFFPALTHCLRLERGQLVEAGSIVRERRATAGRTRGKRPDLQVYPRRNGQPRRGVPELRVRIEKAAVYLGTTPTLSDIELEIYSGQHWAILGPNGSGKSTLLKLIQGDVHAARGGLVQRFGWSARRTIWEVKRRIALVSPEQQALYREPITGEEAIASGWRARVGSPGKLDGPQRSRVRHLIKVFHLESLAPRNILKMSYGEFRKILLARALVPGPELLLCDEPFDGLDASSRMDLSQLLERVGQGGTGLVVVSHHPADLPACTTHIARMEGGRIVAQGARERLGRAGMNGQIAEVGDVGLALRKSPRGPAADR